MASRFKLSCQVADLWVSNGRYWMFKSNLATKESVRLFIIILAESINTQPSSSATDSFYFLFPSDNKIATIFAIKHATSL